MKNKVKIGEVAQICNAVMFGAKVVIKSFDGNDAIVEVIQCYQFGELKLIPGQELRVYKGEVRRV